MQQNGCNPVNYRLPRNHQLPAIFASESEFVSVCIINNSMMEISIVVVARLSK